MAFEIFRNIFGGKKKNTKKNKKKQIKKPAKTKAAKKKAKRKPVKRKKISKKKVAKKKVAKKTKKLPGKKKTSKRKRVKKKISQKKIKKKSVRKKGVKSRKEEEIGVVTHYFGKISVGIIKLKKPLKVGERIEIKGAHVDFNQTINSMQINHQDVIQAKKNAEIGIKVKNKVHPKDKVYKKVA